MVHKVTVPGPINAAAINTPGPMSLTHFIKGYKFYLLKKLHLKKVY